MSSYQDSEDSPATVDSATKKGKGALEETKRGRTKPDKPKMDDY